MRVSQAFKDSLSSNVTKESLYECPEGYIAKCHIRTVMMPSILDTLVGSFVHKSVDPGILVMTDSNGVVDGVSKEASIFFGIDQQNIRNGDLNINYLSKVFDDINSSLNYEIFMEMKAEDVSLVLGREEFTNMRAKKKTLETTLKKLKKGIFIDYRDPFRKELNGMIIGADEKFRLSAGSSDSNDSSENLTDPKGSEIVQGLFDLRCR